MTTSNTIKFRSLALVPMFAAFAVHAENLRADQAVDTQTYIQSILRGTPASTANVVKGQSQARAFDAQARTQRVLLGETNSAPSSKQIASTSEMATATTAERSVDGPRYNWDVQEMTQGVLLGHGF
jgi:hypothetical protein